jgi:uncharacterized protein involved in oxidation of intracellular sulfur
MKTLFILNDPPYGTERVFDALRLANTLLRRETQEVKVFLLGDSVTAANAGQKVPEGYYSLERMLKIDRAKGAEIGVCGTCMDARGLKDEDLVEGARRSSMDALADWVAWADRVLVF